MSNIHDKQAYLQGTHMSFDASERGLFGGILGGINIALRPSRFPNASQNRQGVVKLVDMSPSQRQDKALCPTDSGSLARFRKLKTTESDLFRFACPLRGLLALD